MGNVTVLSKKDNTRNLGFGVKLDAPVVAPLTRDLVFVKSSRVGELTRSTTGTYIDGNDIVRQASIDEARFDGVGIALPDGKGNDGVVNGGVTISDGAMVFDGANSNIDVSSNTQLESLSYFTLSARIKRTGFDSSDAIGIFWKNSQFGLRVRNDFILQGYIFSDTTSVVSGDSDKLINENVEYHVLFIFDGVNGYLYRDNELIGQSPMNIPTFNTNSLYIGRQDSSREWVGILKDLRIWDKSLTETERTQDYNGERVTDGLVAELSGKYYEGTANSPIKIIDTAKADFNTAFKGDGVLIEGQATNLFLNSTAPVTQDITVVNGTTYTISCKGTGSITLSGAGTGTVEDGTPVTITASTTTLTCTISGDLDYAQVEASDFDSSFIITEGTAVTRTKDVLKYETSDLETNNFSMRLDYIPINDGVNGMYLYDSAIDSDNSTSIYYDGSDLIFNKRRNGFDNTSKVSYSFTEGVTSKIGITNSITTGFRLYVDGTEGDLTFSGNDGTVSGGVTIDDGAMVFDGVDGIVTIGSGSDFQFDVGDSITLGGFFKITGPSPNIFIIKTEGSSARSNYILRTRLNKLMFGFSDDVGVNARRFGENLKLIPNTNEIFHFVAVHTFGDASSTKIYLNGVEQEGGTWAGDGNDAPRVTNNYPLSIGNQLVSNIPLGGSMYNVFIYRGIKSSEEIQQIYNAGKDAISPIRDNLVLEMSGREFAGTESSPTTIYDTSNKYGDLQFGTYQYIGSDSDGNNQAQGNYKNLKQYDKTISKTSMEDRTQ